MGIKGIKSLIKKHVPDAIKEIKLNELSGKTICIDSSILLYKYRHIYETDNFHILGFLHKILELLENGIKMVFVFDGKPPEAKRDTLNKRKEQNIKLKEQLTILKEEASTIEFDETFIDSEDELLPDQIEKIKKTKELRKKISALERNVKNVTRQHSFDLMELFKSIGISFFTPDGEAEKACVYLQKNGYADYILTEDTDSLTFGGTNVIFNKKNDYFICYLEKILDGLEINQESFVDLCILCGCDYTTTIPKVGPVTALQMIKKYRSIEIFLSSENKFTVPETFDYQTARELFKTNEINGKLNESIKNKNAFNAFLIRWNLNYFINKFNFLI